MGATTWYQSIFRRNRNQDGDWFGKYWASYGQAVEEAGFASNKLQEAYGEEAPNIRFIELIREIGKIPVKGELLLKRWQDSSFPNEKVFSRCGSKNERIRRVLEYCRSHSGFEDVIQICEQTSLSSEGTPADKPHDGDIGYVYLIKSGKHYKIGKTPPGRRGYELAIQLPGKSTTVHSIKTDDPTGIEVYWHKRFEAKRANGEWFKLDSTDIGAFKRRKFM